MIKCNFIRNKTTESAISVFNRWAQTGKDEGMKNNHFPAFEEAKNIIKEHCKNKKTTTLSDLGCGNGWGTQILNQEKFIYQAIGYDGSKKMIEKAKRNYPNAKFFKTNLNNWKPNQSFDIIYSMEMIYYLSNPEIFITNCYNQWLNKGGLFIAALDYYKENKESLSWPKDLNINMQTKSSMEWKNILEENNFKNCNIKYVNQKKDWNGTLIFWGTKDAI